MKPQGRKREVWSEFSISEVKATKDRKKNNGKRRKIFIGGTIDDWRTVEVQKDRRFVVKTLTVTVCFIITVSVVLGEPRLQEFGIQAVNVVLGTIVGYLLWAQGN
jgi:hypothetical protein